VNRTSGEGADRRSRGQREIRSWITLAAIATATDRIRLGPMVTPFARRRPVKVARETATLDRLSGGRLTLGAGLGSDELGGVPSAHVVHAETDHAEVVPIFRVTPRDE
jgi:alkanesulfonate monooxygenase SsuD/methylene tetrahydromethanopterin reductase-like flavin-dependent oxidoreductase (luciferase family)